MIIQGSADSVSPRRCFPARAFRGDALAEARKAILHEDPSDKSEASKRVSPLFRQNILLSHCLGGATLGAVNPLA
jgi:hypothetical protein